MKSENYAQRIPRTAHGLYFNFLEPYGLGYIRFIRTITNGVNFGDPFTTYAFKDLLCRNVKKYLFISERFRNDVHSIICFISRSTIDRFRVDIKVELELTSRFDGILLSHQFSNNLVDFKSI